MVVALSDSKEANVCPRPVQLRRQVKTVTTKLPGIGWTILSLHLLQEARHIVYTAKYGPSEPSLDIGKPQISQCNGNFFTTFTFEIVDSNSSQITAFATFVTVEGEWMKVRFNVT
jgi:hypothetical protein